MRLSRAGLDVNGDGVLACHARLLDGVLRRVAQVMSQDNSFTGLLFVVGIGVNSRLFLAAVLLGTAVSTLAAETLGADRELVRLGMFGFNVGLVGIALLYFVQPTPLTWGCVLLAAVCSTVVMAAMLAAFDTWRLPALTAPFVVTSICFFLATARFGRLASTWMLPTAGLPKAASVEGIVTASTIAEGLFHGIAKVFFQANTVTGMLFALGLLVASRLAFAAALAGSLGGMLVAWGMGPAEPAIRAGAFGFNNVPVAAALFGVFAGPGRATAMYAPLAIVVTSIVVATATAALQPLGVRALSLPFVLVVWAFLFAGQVFANLQTPQTLSPDDKK